MERKVCCLVANAFLSGLELNWLISLLFSRSQWVKLTQNLQLFGAIFCLYCFPLKFWNNFKLHTKKAVNNIFIQEKILLWLTFNPGLALTGFQTTWPHCLVTICYYYYYMLNHISLECKRNSHWYWKVAAWWTMYWKRLTLPAKGLSWPPSC